MTLLPLSHTIDNGWTTIRTSAPRGERRRERERREEERGDREGRERGVAKGERERERERGERRREREREGIERVENGRWNGRGRKEKRGNKI